MKDDVLATVFGSVSFSSLFAGLQDVVDIVWKIGGIISAVIAFICFVKPFIKKWIEKYNKAKADGIITKEEATDLVNTVKDDTSVIINEGMDLYSNCKNDYKKDGE